MQQHHLTSPVDPHDDSGAGPPGRADGGAGGSGAARTPAWDSHKLVLVVDDEPGILDSLQRIFRREGLEVVTASDAAAGLEVLRRQRVSVLLTDLMMPRTTGMDLLKAAKTVAPETEVVLMTAYGTVETAVAAMKEGAYDFVTKPLKRAHVVRIVRNALEKQSLVIENRALRAQLSERRRRAIIGTSLSWRRRMSARCTRAMTPVPMKPTRVIGASLMSTCLLVGCRGPLQAHARGYRTPLTTGLGPVLCR